MTRRRLATLWPPALAATAVLALLGGPTLLPLALGADEPFAASERTAFATGAVPDAWLAGLASLRGGRHDVALRELAAAEAERGNAPPALLRARLHAALLAGDLVDAEHTVEKLALRTGDPALRDFVVGLAEFARSRRVGLQAAQPGADPTAFDRAIRHATAAVLAFQEASLATAERDWPAARRNAERAAKLRTELQRQKEQSERDRKREPDKKEDEPDPDEVDRIEQRLRLAQDQGLLSAAELQALLARLAKAEDEKRDVRRAVRDARSAAVERDW